MEKHKYLALGIVAITSALLISPVYAQTVTYTATADDDLAIYVGNITGSNLRQVVDKTTFRTTIASGSFSLLPGEDYIYLLSMNFGSSGDIGGTLNGTSFTASSWVTKDVTSSITGLPSSFFQETFNPVLGDVQSAIAAGGITGGTTIGAVGVGTVSTLLSLPTFLVPDGSTATLFRQPSGAAATAPEPGTFALALLGFTGGILRRRKK
jgi:hypothetical protein